MELRDFRNLPIDWDMTPTDAVTLYLEWGNNSWTQKHQAVRSKEDVTHYFVINTWENPPRLKLIKRNSEAAVELLDMPLPPAMERKFRDEWGNLKGVYEPTEDIKNWLKQQLAN